MKVSDKVSTLESIKENDQFSAVIQGLLSDGVSEDMMLSYLQTTTLHEALVGGELVGFYSIEDCGDHVEAHAYVFPTQRKHSLGVLRHIIKSQVKHIKTSVHGTHPHVMTFLTKLGFVLTQTHHQALCKNGKYYDVWDLILRRDK